jgi:hypothetical protein
VLLTRTSRRLSLRAWCAAIANRTGVRCAKVVAVPKLAVVLQGMWRDGSEVR